MKIACAGGAVTKETEHHAVFLAKLKCPRDSDGKQQQKTKHQTQRVHRKIAGNCVAAFIAHPMQQDVMHREAVQERGGILTIIRNDVIDSLAERLARSERRGFLPLVLRERSHPAGPLKLERLIVKL